MNKLSRISYQPVIDALCATRRLPPPEFEWRFHPKRKWRFDVAWVPWRIALEVEGGIFINGRHSRGGGMLKDMEKYNEAAALGWRVLRCTPGTILTGMEFAERCLEPHRP